MDPATTTVAIRWAWLLIPSVPLALLLAFRPSGRRAGGAAFVASVWCMPALVAVNAAARTFDWWHFRATGGLLFGLPIEALIGWSLWWGAIPALSLHRMPVPVVVLLALWIDLLGMPQCRPVLELGPHWIVGEIVALTTVLVPALVLARWTREERRPFGRAALQAIAFAGLTFFLLPAAALSWEGDDPINRVHAAWADEHIMLLPLVGPALALALSAVVEFATRGRGTPFPLDPPQRLVVSGPYAYVRNPMQLGTTLLMLAAAAAIASGWLAAAGGVAVVFSVGFATWDEAKDLPARFGQPYARYRKAVRSWWPRWRPYRELNATLYFAQGCEACEGVARFVRWLGPSALDLVPAQESPDPLTRVTYCDGEWKEQGVAAVGRALEHTTLPLAVLGFAIRLPVVRPVLQLMVDASGGHPRAALAVKEDA